MSEKTTTNADSFKSPKHVVVVMDALKEFSMEPLEWVLKNVAVGLGAAPCIVTLLGVMPWLNIPRIYIILSSPFPCHHPSYSFLICWIGSQNFLCFSYDNLSSLYIQFLQRHGQTFGVWILKTCPSSLGTPRMIPSIKNFEHC